MQRPHFHPARCRVCGFEGTREEISQQGFCPEHSEERFRANLEQLRSQRGPFFEHWAMRTILSARRALTAANGVALDDLREKA